MLAAARERITPTLDLSGLISEVVKLLMSDLVATRMKPPVCGYIKLE